MCWSSDVGLGDVCVSNSCGGYHLADTFALERPYAKSNANCSTDRGLVAERDSGRGAMNASPDASTYSQCAIDLCYCSCEIEFGASMPDLIASSERW